MGKYSEEFTLEGKRKVINKGKEEDHAGHRTDSRGAELGQSRSKPHSKLSELTESQYRPFYPLTGPQGRWASPKCCKASEKLNSKERDKQCHQTGGLQSTSREKFLTVLERSAQIQVGLRCWEEKRQTCALHGSPGGRSRLQQRREKWHGSVIGTGLVARKLPGGKGECPAASF